jgi:hypothetical protein
MTMFAEIDPADVYAQVAEVKLMVECMFGVGILLAVLALTANGYLVWHKYRLNANFDKAVQRMEMWLSLVELHYSRGAAQKEQTAEDTKFVKEFLERAAREGKLPAQAMQELQAAIAAVPKKVVTELEKADGDSGVRKRFGTGDSHHGH